MLIQLHAEGHRTWQLARAIELLCSVSNPSLKFTKWQNLEHYSGHKKYVSSPDCLQNLCHKTCTDLNLCVSASIF